MTQMFVTLAISATLLFVCLTISNAENIKTPLFVFGDSLYDIGMSFYSDVEGAGAKHWPYGEHYFNQPVGRYSDGLVIPDFIAQFAGLDPLQPYLVPRIVNYANGINFASSNACVLTETCVEAINLKMQLDYFVQMVQNLTQQVGKLEANRLLSKAVYLFNIGSDDYVTLFQTTLKKRLISPLEKKLYMKQILGNLTIHIKTIYNQGGRKFAFQNVGPIGCMPSVKYTLDFNGTCAQEPLELARMHNAAFSAVAKRLLNELPGFKYSIYDFYVALHQRVLYGNTYGFKESEIACCGSGAFNGDYSCQMEDRTFSVCNSLNDYLWFDARHPTHKANHQFAKEFWSGGPDVVAPYNLHYLFAMP